MEILTNVFFWALVSMFGLVGAGAVVSGKKLGRYPLFGALMVMLFDVGRIILVLPICPQHRFELFGLHWIIGGSIFAIGLIFCTPALLIKPVTVPDNSIVLRTKGLYGIVRNPIYTGELLWCFGLAVMFRSTVGFALLPLWWLGLLFHIMIEEESLERELGEPYLEYKRRVKGRLIPGLPF